MERAAVIDGAETADNVESASLPAHVAMCRMRYTGLDKRMRRVEYGIYAVAGAAATVALKVVGMSPDVIAKIVALVR